MLTGSSRVDPFTGRDQPGTYTCCTARYVGKSFKLKPNKITTKKVNVKVYNLVEKELQIRIHSSDGLALSFGRGGTVPLKITNSLGELQHRDPAAHRLLGAHPQGRPPRRRLLDVRHRPDVPVELQAVPPLVGRPGCPS